MRRCVGAEEKIDLLFFPLLLELPCSWNPLLPRVLFPTPGSSQDDEGEFARILGTRPKLEVQYLLASPKQAFA